MLLNFQLLRLISIIEMLQTDPTKIPQEDVRFLEVLHRKFGLSHQFSFTFVALEQLLKAIEANGNHILENSKKSNNNPTSRYKSHRRSRLEVGPVTEILSDYYVVTSSYSDDRLTQMRNLINVRPNIGFYLRAGLITDKNNLNGFKG